ncbi:MAG: hypothetical protein JST16_00800 [Bdellovibrionales bacterium]|nr:hypothetical protein [Bdellovibrionales bacterium]
MNRNTQLRLSTLFFFAAACSSAPRKATTQGVENEPIFAPFQHSVKDSAARREAITKMAAGDGSLKLASNILIHNDFHPLRVEYVQGNPQIEGIESAGEGPWWLDLIRMESMAVVLADEQSLKGFKEGACLDSYTKTLAWLDNGPEPAGANPWGVAIAPRVKNPQPEKSALWTNAAKDVAPELTAVFNQAFDNKITVSELRRIAADPALSHPTRIVARMSDGSWTEFRQLSGSCETFLKAAKVFRASKDQSAEAKCLTSSGVAYGVQPFSTVAFVTKDFKADATLSNHVRWMCHEIAQVHARQMGSKKLRELRFALERRKALKERVLFYSRQEAGSILNAYRSNLPK